MKILITGATGFVGAALIKELLKRGHSVHALSRNIEKAQSALGDKVSVFKWSSPEVLPPTEAFSGVEAVIHLAGEPVGNGRWSDETKKRIVNSRTIGTENLVRAMEALPVKPSVFISASAIGYYGSRGDEQLTETSAAGSGFLAEVCQAWEKAASVAPIARKVIFRIAVVLGKNGGALEKILPPFRLGAGGRIGKGQQYMSWIHLSDLVQLLAEAVTDSKFKGTFNAAAPDAVTNEEFTADLGKLLGRPTVMTVPPFALKMILGEMAEETLLASQRVDPAHRKELKYEFQFPRLTLALKDLLA